MSTLQEFLKKRADLERAEMPRKHAIQGEWRAAVDRLISRLQEWLGDADQDKILEIQLKTHHRREEGIGVYDVIGLVVRLEAREVQIIPIARNVVGPVASTGPIHVARSFGRVDMTNGVEKYLIFRTQVEPSDQWAIVNEDDFAIQALDRRSFDAAMQSLLQ